MLDIAHVEVRFGAFVALDDVSLRVDGGEIVVLLGANGAGKSTLFRTIVGLLRPARGTIRLRGVEISRLPAHVIVRQGLALSPEGRHLFPQLSVRKNLLLGAYATPRPQTDADESLDEVCALFPVLREKMEAPAGALSGGQQQMVALARALMARPGLLLLDEPSLGLAPLVVKQLLDAVAAINGRGTTVLMAEQNAHAALSIASRGYVMENGRVVLEGSRESLLGSEDVQRAYLGI